MERDVWGMGESEENKMSIDSILILKMKIFIAYLGLD